MSFTPASCQVSCCQDRTQRRRMNLRSASLTRMTTSKTTSDPRAWPLTRDQNRSSHSIRQAPHPQILPNLTRVTVRRIRGYFSSKLVHLAMDTRVQLAHANPNGVPREEHRFFKTTTNPTPDQIARDIGSGTLVDAGSVNTRISSSSRNPAVNCRVSVLPSLETEK